jgi:hypothetical protein
MAGFMYRCMYMTRNFDFTFIEKNLKGSDGVYDTQNHWVFGHCSSPGILEIRKQNVFRELDLFPSSGEGETHTLLGPLERADLNHWTTHVRFTTAI